MSGPISLLRVVVNRCLDWARSWILRTMPRWRSAHAAPVATTCGCSLATLVTELLSARAVNMVTCFHQLTKAPAGRADFVALATIGSIQSILVIFLLGFQLLLAAVIGGTCDGIVWL
jgi:hypothetical protein